MMSRVLVALALAAAARAAPHPDQADDGSRTTNGLTTSYGVPAEAIPSHTAIVYEPVQYEVVGYGVQPHKYDTLFEETSLSSPISSVLGYKVSAIGLIIKAIGWLIVHSWSIVLGALATLAFCKFTSFCDLSFKNHFHEYARSLMTPERISSTSKLIEEAVEKYSENKIKKA